MPKVKIGEAITLKLFDSNVQVNTITYTSRNPIVATVSAGGVVTAIAVGNSVVDGVNTADGSKASVMIEVIANTPPHVYKFTTEKYILVPTVNGFNTLTGGVYTGALVTGTKANTRFMNPQKMSIDPATGFIYVADLQGFGIVSVDPATGDTTLFKSVPSPGAYCVTAPGDGNVYYMTSSGGQVRLNKVVISSGTTTTIASFSGITPSCLIMHQGKLCFGIYSATQIRCVDTLNGNAVTNVTAPSDNEFTAYNGYLYYSKNALGLYKQPIAGGTETLISSTTFSASGATFDNDGNLYVIGGIVGDGTHVALKAVKPDGTVVTLLTELSGAGTILGTTRSLKIDSSKNLLALVVDSASLNFVGIKKAF